ncbi:MAG: ABC transporter ATP-binding protein [Candidatus Promineifilaceae bacterium]|nr:ABC transporter ATP-binding protein [Candidatus Promineifilaceae bacterium]
MMNASEQKTILAVDNLTVQFGGLTALDNVTMHVAAGQRFGILGPNGAGKTTLFNAVCGFVTPAKGKVALFDVDITRMPAYRRVSQGLVRTFQITTLFPELTVFENVLMASLVTTKRHRRFWRFATGNAQAVALAQEQLEQLNLAYLAESSVGDLSYGEQRLLEIAVALASNPTVLMLDEPTAGLSAAEITAVVALINGLSRDLSVVIIEHDLDVIFDIAEYLSVLHFGKVIANGPTAEVSRNERVKDVYLGEA